MDKNFKKGDTVVMHSCFEARKEGNRGKIWVCKGDSFETPGKLEVVFLEGYSGYFSCDMLQLVDTKPFQEMAVRNHNEWMSQVGSKVGCEELERYIEHKL